MLKWNQNTPKIVGKYNKKVKKCNKKLNIMQKMQKTRYKMTKKVKINDEMQTI